MSKGIDYGLGTTNIDKKTGIRYGVISQHSVMPEALDKLEPDYGPATCPKCGNDAEAMPEGEDPVTDEWEDNGNDYICRGCRYAFESDEAFPEESNGFTYDEDGYQLTDCLDSDIFVLKSPYYTYAEFCSLCVPGAGNLDGSTEEGEKTYCLGHDWFEGGKAPYPVFSVATGKEIIIVETQVTCTNCHGSGRDSVVRTAECWACFDYSTKTSCGYRIEKIEKEKE